MLTSQFDMCASRAYYGTMTNYTAQIHTDWHHVAAMEGTPASLCPFDCGAGDYEAEYLASLEAEAAGLDALAAEDVVTITCAACKKKHVGERSFVLASVRRCSELARAKARRK